MPRCRTCAERCAADIRRIFFEYRDAQRIPPRDAADIYERLKPMRQIGSPPVPPPYHAAALPVIKRLFVLFLARFPADEMLIILSHWHFIAREPSIRRSVRRAMPSPSPPPTAMNAASLISVISMLQRIFAVVRLVGACTAFSARTGGSGSLFTTCAAARYW